MDGPQPTVVSLLDIYTKQIEMKVQLAVINEKLADLPDHEARLRTLERFRFTLLGAAVAVSAVVSTVGTWVGVAISHR
jgi:hypothetical protein